MGFSEKILFDHEKVTNFQKKKMDFIFSIYFFIFFFKTSIFSFNIALNLTFGHIQPLILAAKTEGRKLKTFVFGRKFQPLVIGIPLI